MIIVSAHRLRIVFLTLPLAFLAHQIIAAPSRADAPRLVKCPVNASADARLMVEQWTASERCDKPVRTRVTDRYLGYTCTEKIAGTIVCRAFMPGPGSQVFDTSKQYRCLELGTVPTDDGPRIVGLREWAAPGPKQCEYDTNNTIASELDLVNREICITGLCIAPARLSVVGRLRLRKLTESAFRDLGLVIEDQANAGSGRASALTHAPQRGATRGFQSASRPAKKR